MDSTLSMSVRLRRVTTETTQVSVPVTQEVMKSGSDGPKIDVDKVIEAALQLGNLESVSWESEGPPEIQLHPIQSAPETKTTIQ